MEKSERISAIVIRHGERPLFDKSEMGIEVLLTENGKQKAVLFGKLLRNHAQSIRLFSSPVKRCIETAECIANGFGVKPEISLSNILGLPGCYVRDEASAGEYFQNLGCEAVVENLIAGIEMDGIRTLKAGACIMMDYVTDNITDDTLSVFVSHDAIVAPFISTLTGDKFSARNWIGFLEGVAIIKTDKGLAFNRISNNINTFNNK